MAKIKYGVEGLEGVQRKSDRIYTHAVVGTYDCVATENYRFQWHHQRPEAIKSREKRYAAAVRNGSNPKLLAEYATVQAYHDGVLSIGLAAVAKAATNATLQRPKAISFHGSLELAARAARAQQAGFEYHSISVQPVISLTAKVAS